MTASLMLLTSSLAHADTSRCSLATVMSSRTAIATMVLARALPDTQAAPANLSDFDPEFRPTAEELARQTPVARRFLALSVWVGEVEIEPGETFLIVPWDYGISCEPMAWTESAQWVGPGEEVFFLFLPRNRPKKGVEPIVDVFGDQSRYPTASLWKWEQADDPAHWLTAREYCELLMALPIAWWHHRDDDPIRRRLQDAFAGSDRWRSAFPGSHIYRMYRRRST